MRAKLKKNIFPLILILLIPQIVNLMTCYMMSDKQLTELPMGVYVGDNSSLTREIVRNFDNNETFDVKYYADSPSEIESLMEDGSIVFGLVIPKDFTKDLKKLKSPTILTVFDGTQLSSASFTKLAATEILLTTKTGAMINAFQGKFNMSPEEALNTARTIEINNRVVGNPTRNYINFLLPGMMIALVQVGIAMTTGGAAIERGNRKATNYFFEKIGTYSVLGFVSILMVIGVQHLLFEVPFKGRFIDVAILAFAFSSCVSTIGIFIATIIEDKVFSAQIAAVFFIPSSILSGYTWPIIAMPSFFKKFALILPFTYFGDALRDLLLRGESRVYTNNLLILVSITIVMFFIILVVEKAEISLSLKGDKKIESLN